MRANLRATIEAKFGSQQAFAKAAGVHFVRLNRVVNGWVEPTPIERERFRELLKVDASWLFQVFVVPATDHIATATCEDGSSLREIAAELGRIATNIPSKF